MSIVAEFSWKEQTNKRNKAWNIMLVVQEEAEEQEAREELFREALVKEIEGKVGVMRELEQGADKEKELV